MIKSKLCVSILACFALISGCVPAPDDGETTNLSELNLQIDQEPEINLKGDGRDPFMRAVQQDESGTYKTVVSISWDLHIPSDLYQKKLSLNFPGNEVTTHTQYSPEVDQIFLTLEMTGILWESYLCTSFVEPLTFTIVEYAAKGGRVKGSYAGHVCSNDITGPEAERFIQGDFDVPNLGDIN